ncbi:MAG: hypothetical protein LBL79_12280 [Prevotella sp.]|jgi:hypothetical protein|nr:hypothetical protein [Prevotella sp.]
MDNCYGSVIIALERTYFPSGLKKRGSVSESVLKEAKFPTPWNQIESAMAYSKGQPLMIIIEEGLKTEGLLERGFDWYVLYLKPDRLSLFTPEFDGVLLSWRNKVEQYKNSKNEKARKKIDVAELTIGDLIKKLRTTQMWAVLAGLAAMLAGAFMLGQYLVR